ncbi:MAG TPA: hypothetical protein IAB27_02545 [Candidatus Coprosoma intestinipullorum]|uniref:Uncharacterized protein n=1 Tax=Candidatus Coprosoma intestinipullorum TaxID=2840752 RepID=A0A9D0ZQT7_9FIRM|nr:hypothetical protein [Candidatus Coprosoma intestinipullorum]
MGFLTNWVFWVILAVIVFLMVIIGFLAEGSIFKKKDKTTIGDDNTDSDSTVSSVQTPDAFVPLKSASVPSTPETLNVNPVNTPAAETLNVNPVNTPQAEMLNVSPITDNNLNNEKTENVHQSSEDIFNEVPDTLQEVKIETLDDNLQTSASENNQNEEVNQMPNTPENGTDIWNI